MDTQCLDKLRADRHVRRERGQRVLENHGDVRTAQAVQCMFVQRQKLPSLKKHGAGRGAVGSEKSEARKKELALSRSRLACHPEALARPHFQRNALHGVNFTIGRVKAHVEIANLKQRTIRGNIVSRRPRRAGGLGEAGGPVSRPSFEPGLHQRSFGSSASRRPSPMKLKAKSVAAMNSDGKTSSHGADSIWSAPCEISTPQEVSGS